MKTWSILSIVFGALVTVASCALGQATAIRAGKLVDPETGTTATNQVILVEGSKIKSVGAGLAIPAGATVIDLSSATVLPGLFDAHTHMCLRLGLGTGIRNNLYFTTLLESTAYRTIEGVVNAREVLESGFTTIRDVGNGANFCDSDLRKAIDAGLIPGPTMLNAGRIITPFGGQFPGLITPEKPDLGKPEYFYADTRDDMLKAIRENVYYGAKVIKIVVDNHPYLYSIDDIKFMVEESAKAGARVAAHANSAEGAHNAVVAGVASIEHGPELTDADLALMKQKNIYLVGTDFPQRLADALGNPGQHKIFVERLKRAYRIGTLMAFGTDEIFWLPNETRGTLTISFIDSWVEAGIPATVILQGLTSNAARLLGVEKDRGAIKPGLAADIIATAENPLENINTLKQVSFVMKDGKIVKRGR
jgi:imidazolonepropionase-like amidohydrolase